jgi:Tfp pilus assembly protein PilN
MATTLTPPERAPAGAGLADAEPTNLAPLAMPDEHSLRVPDIAADLLPVEVFEARRGRQVRRFVLGALAVFTLLLGGWYAVATYQTVVARNALEGAQDDAQRLTLRQRAYADLVTAQAESTAINSQLAALMADDLQWAKLLSSLQDAAPSGVRLTGVTGALSTGTAAGTSTGTPANAIGSLNLTGTAGTKALVAAYVDALGKVAGVANPLLGDITTQGTTLNFTIRMDIMKAALGGRYTKPSTAPSTGGGK